MINLCLKGLPGPIAIAPQLGGIAEDLARVLVGWPSVCREEMPSGEPLMIVNGRPDEIVLVHRDLPGRTVERTMTSAICTLIVELMADFVHGDESLGNLHAGAVEFDGRLVVFPATNRAGKSTLVAALSAEGRRVFADDLLPVDLAGLEAVASGCLPRLRLPLPDSATPKLVAHVDRHAILSDGYYAYLPPPDPAAAVPHGTRAPIGAVVLLDRRDEAVPAVIEPVEPDEGLLRILLQDTKRELGTWAFDRYLALIGGAELHRLTYTRVDDAVACLESAFASWPEAPAAPVGVEAAPDDDLHDEQSGLDIAPRPGLPVIRRAGHVVSRMVGLTAFLVDISNNEIHHLNVMGLALWNLIATPLDEETIAEIFQAAFPDAPPETVRADLAAVIARFVSAGLVERR